jgi:hypothetical protein
MDLRLRREGREGRIRRMNAPIPKQLSPTEARGLFAMNVARWCALMTERKLMFAPFAVSSPGLHDERIAFEVGVHCELLAERGYEVVSHAVAVVADQHGPKTIVSLLVKAPTIVTATRAS